MLSFRRKQRPASSLHLVPTHVGRRMLCLCLAFGGPLGGLAYVGYESRAAQSDFIKSEQVGLELLAPAVALLESQLELEMQRSTATQASSADLKSRVETRDRLASVLLDRDSGASVRRVPSVSARLGDLRRALAEEDAAAGRDTASAPVASIVSLFDSVAAASKLSQDSELASYYLTISVTNTLPEALANASNLTRLGVSSLRSGTFTAEGRTRLIALTTALEDDSRALQRHFSTMATIGSSAVAAEVHQPLLRFTAATSRLLDAGEKLGRDAVVKPTPQEVRTLGAETMAANFALVRNAMELLDNRLQDRRDELDRRQLLVLGLATGVLAVTAGLLVVTAADARARRAAEEALLHQAAHDPLTGLANRRAYMDALVGACASSGRTGMSVGVLFLDLDDFKLVNDRLGHEAGDRLLLEVAARVRRTIRNTDIAARLGGDEFAVVLNHLRHPEDAEVVANALLCALRDPVEINDQLVAIHASIGVSVASTDIEAEALLASADAAMYAAKQRGKGSVEVCRATTAPANERAFRLSDLNNALANDELLLHFQPIVALDSGAVQGLEALLRWQHPDRGLVSPATFIPYAERTDLIVPIGRWVLYEACREVAAWRAAQGRDDLFVSINISGRQLTTDDILSDVRSALDEHGLPANSLVLEVTETATVSGSAEIHDRLQRLRDMGVRIAIDDFGTGYSSLSYLCELPVDIVKLDKSFVDRLGSAGSDELARALIALIQTLGYQPIAEGIELEQQATLLADFGCGLGQGFHLARPTTADNICATIGARPPDDGQACARIGTTTGAH